MPAIDLVDETFIAAAPAAIAEIVSDPHRWAEWWPDFSLRVFMDRGSKGIRWSVSGTFVGSTEIWIEPVLDGAVLHYYLRVDPPDGTPLGRRDVNRARSARAKAWKAIVWRLKDELEGSRAPGTGASRSG
ncbi:MAG: polyketide cyclase / dehydrase and lipid transport [Candidatus Nanopelagicales bacterium]|nr:polyketide cyclase / dehydrase and lipid transport [Candidatus Nanopelagicales bacterium]